MWKSLEVVLSGLLGYTSASHKHSKIERYVRLSDNDIYHNVTEVQWWIKFLHKDIVHMLWFMFVKPTYIVICTIQMMKWCIQYANDDIQWWIVYIVKITQWYDVYSVICLAQSRLHSYSSALTIDLHDSHKLNWHDSDNSGQIVWVVVD